MLGEDAVMDSDAGNCWHVLLAGIGKQAQLEPASLSYQQLRDMHAHVHDDCFSNTIGHRSKVVKVATMARCTINRCTSECTYWGLWLATICYHYKGKM
mmetsp:Transcript_87753/g.174193  ORF Transcript_87753/g.174193 Transcript_87753/m.174193 type:complete len:98 (-) Transcript_87753:2328-2621(-)